MIIELKINIFLKEGVLDPAATAIKTSLKGLGFNNIEELTIKKQLCLKLECKDELEAKEEASKMCEQLLVNEVIEKYELVL